MGTVVACGSPVGLIWFESTTLRVSRDATEERDEAIEDVSGTAMVTTDGMVVTVTVTVSAAAQGASRSLCEACQLWYFKEWACPSFCHPVNVAATGV